MTVYDVYFLEYVVFFHPILYPSVLFACIGNSPHNVLQLVDSLQLFLEGLALETGIYQLHLNRIFIFVNSFGAIKSFLEISQS